MLQQLKEATLEKHKAVAAQQAECHWEMLLYHELHLADNQCAEGEGLQHRRHNQVARRPSLLRLALEPLALLLLLQEDKARLHTIDWSGSS